MSIKRNYLLNLSNSILNILFPIITFPYASRVLSPQGIGETQIVYSYAQYFGLLAAFGVPIYGVKAISECINNEKKLTKTTSELLFMNLLSSIICTGLFFSIGLQLSLFSNQIEALLIASCMVIMSVFNVDWYFGAKEKFDLILKRTIFIKCFSLIILFGFVQNTSDSIIYLFFLTFLWVGNYTINAIYLFKNQALTIKNLNLSKHIKPLFLILSMTLAATIYTSLDSVLLGFFAGEEEVGLYTAGVKLSKVAIPIITSLGLVIIPKATRLNQIGDHQKEIRLYNKTFSLTAFISIPLAIGLRIISSEAVELFSGESFIDAIPAMNLLAYLPIFIGFGHFVAFHILVPKGINHGMFWSTFIGMILFGAMSYYLMPRYGSLGASIANISTEVVVTLCYLFFIPKIIRRSLPWKKIIYCLISTLPFIPIAIFIRSLELSTLITLITIVSFCAFFYGITQKYIFKEIIIEEGIQFIRKTIKSNG